MSNKDAPLDDDDPNNGGGSATIRLQEFFLPVHGYVRLHPAEVAIVNHPSFQRLRKCRQLGFAHLVFPGAVHTRFEHSIGAVYVADKMIQYVNFNFDASSGTAKTDQPYRICEIADDARRFIRLGALLHDIGHIPLGHTLEDELEHLEKHDGEDRVERLKQKLYPEYRIDPALKLGLNEPPGGWSLPALIDALYAPLVLKLFSSEKEKKGDPLSAFEILKMITLKEPEGKDALAVWKTREKRLEGVLPVSVCRDIIGNTICADFLDYLFRDWYHVGKPMTEDRRLYQYMEVRVDKENVNAFEAQQFVINVGPDHKLRHDALTCIFELLEGRYKLAETVLFHRTKLAMTALLDRCFLELRHLYSVLDIKGKFDSPKQYFSALALELLLDCSDDDVPAVIRKLATGVTPEDNERINFARERHRTYADVALQSATDREQLSLLDADKFDVDRQLQLIETLVERLETRTMYTLAARLPRRALDVDERPESTPEDLPVALQDLVQPDIRRRLIVMIESRLGLPRGSVTLYAPPNAKMNAKIAQVKLLINNRIKTFAQYEKDMDKASLTGGLADAQIRRFFELWAVSIYVDRPQWHKFDESLQSELARVVPEFVYLRGVDRVRAPARRKEIEALLRRARSVAIAAREMHNDIPLEDEFAGEKFISGMPFDAEPEKN